MIPRASSDWLQTEGDYFTLRTIRDLSEVESLRGVWKSWQNTRDSDLDFFLGMVRSRGNSCRPHVVVLSRSARPDVLLVGLSYRTRIPLRLGSVTIRQAEVNLLEFVYGGLLGNASKENCAALVREVMRSLAEGDADVAVWEHLDVHSALYTCARQLPSLLSQDHSHCLRDHWFTNFPKDLDAFLLSLGHSQGSKLRRKYKRVLNSFPGRIQVRSYRTVADLKQAIPHMEEIARKSVKRQLGFGFFDTSQTREQLGVEATRGWLRVYILYIEEKPVSFWKGTLYEHCLHADQAGFDAGWSAFSPGIFLFLNVLENLCDEDIRTIDFGCGDGQLFKCFGKVRRPEASIRIYAPNPTALQLNLQHTLAHYITLLVRRIPCLKWTKRLVWNRSRARALFPRVRGQEPPLPSSLPPAESLREN